MNVEIWERGSTVSFLAIYVSNFRCSATLTNIFAKLTRPNLEHLGGSEKHQGFGNSKNLNPSRGRKNQSQPSPEWTELEPKFEPEALDFGAPVGHPAGCWELKFYYVCVALSPCTTHMCFPPTSFHGPPPHTPPPPRLRRGLQSIYLKPQKRRKEEMHGTA